MALQTAVLMTTDDKRDLYLKRGDETFITLSPVDVVGCMSVADQLIR